MSLAFACFRPRGGQFFARRVIVCVVLRRMRPRSWKLFACPSDVIPFFLSLFARRLTWQLRLLVSTSAPRTRASASGRTSESKSSPTIRATVSLSTFGVFVSLVMLNFVLRCRYANLDLVREYNVLGSVMTFLMMIQVPPRHTLPSPTPSVSSAMPRKTRWP